MSRSIRGRRLRRALLAPLVIGAGLPLLGVLADPASAVGLTATPGQLVISEFRVRGTNFANDEFIEIANASGVDHSVTAASGTGYGVAASDGTTRCSIPNGTVIPARGHYLCVNSMGYSLASYPAGNGTTATGDATYTTEIPDNAGIALFNNNSGTDSYVLANRLDAVGSTSEANTLYKEGTGYPALTPFDINYSFFRTLTTSSITSAGFENTAAPGTPMDTDNNAANFTFVDTNGTSAGAGQRLGAPGPENLSSPVSAGNLDVSLFDECAGENAAPNVVRDFTSDPANNSTFGTLDYRRTITNNTGANVTRMRIRVADIRTFPAPSGFSDMRPRTSTAVVSTVDRAPCGSGTSNVTVQGTTLEQPPSQPNGGGFNSSMSVGTITLGAPLANGASVDVRLLTGIQQTGKNSVRFIVEALPDETSTAPDVTCVGATTTPSGSPPMSESTNFCRPNPVGNADSYSVTEDSTLTRNAAQGVLANDTDPDTAMTSVTATKLTDPTNGSVTAFGTDGSFTYVPNANFAGTDTFTYEASDGTNDSAATTVTITVNGVNDLPVNNDDSYSTDEDTTLTRNAAQGVLANDTDADHFILTASVVSGVSNGVLDLNPDGSFEYVPNANSHGTDSFTYQANDGTADSAAPATVTITVGSVNDVPAVQNDTYSATEDNDLVEAAVTGVLANDSDAENETMSASVVANPANGAVVLATDGSFTYTPDADFQGADGFTYQANDGTADSSVATVTINVAGVNDAPVAAADTYGTNEDVTLSVNAANGVLDNDADPVENSSLTAAVVSTTTNGMLNLAADGSFGYVPNPNFSGTDSFTYKANDGTTDSNTVTVTITVTAVNDAPVATGETYSTNEDIPLVQSAPGVLANDTDIDLETLSATVVTGPSNGMVDLNADGSFTYTPDLNYNGPDSFTYKANDGATDSNVVTVAVTVNAVNDAPVAAADMYGTDEGTTLAIDAANGVLDNDTDPVENSPLTAVGVSNPTHGTLTLATDGSFGYIPNPNFNGTDSFTYKANDDTNDSNVATVLITVTGVNDAPVATGDTYSTSEDAPLVRSAPGVLANDTDIDNDILSAIVVTGPAYGVLDLDADGGFTYTPDANENGPDSFTYKVNDGTVDSNVVTVNLSVAAVDDAPVAHADSYDVTTVDTLSVDAPGVLDNDTDAESNELTATLVDDVDHGTLTFDADGSFDYVPAIGFDGDVTFTYTATGNGLVSAPATVTIAVEFVLPDEVPEPNATIGLDHDQVTAGGTVSGTIGGFTPGEHVRLYLYPDQTLLTEAIAGPDGTVSFTLDLDGVAPGDYSIVAIGDDHTASQTLEVTAPRTITARPPATTRGGASSLPRTGFGFAVLYSTGFALLLTGGALHLMQARRRRHPIEA